MLMCFVETKFEIILSPYRDFIWLLYTKVEDKYSGGGK